MDMKKTVRCKESWSNLITEGYDYTVLHEYHGLYLIICNNLSEKLIDKTYFIDTVLHKPYNLWI